MSFDIDIALRRGSFERRVAFRSAARVTALVGPSGGGKTSTLLAIAGLLRPESGRIVVAGRCLFDAAAGIDVPAAQRRLGVMFQDERLFPHLTVAANLGYAGAGGAAVAAMAAQLGIAPLLGRYPRQLSGGEARRVALGRALLARPAALLLDEPLGQLDPERAAALLGLIGATAASLPLLLVTHDLDEAKALGAEVVAI